jgi:hypothetical protein
MELSPREATSRSTFQEFPFILWKPKVYYCLHMSPLLAPTLGQVNIVHTISFYLYNIHIISLPHMSGSF